MRISLPTVAAIAAGALLLSRRRGSHLREPAYEMQEATHTSLGVLGALLGAGAAVAVGGMLLSRKGRSSSEASGESTVEESIELDVPVSTAYNQWTQFEQFPSFMATVQQVNQVDDTHLHWRANVAGQVKEWDAEITEQIPDQRIAWRSIGGVRNAGVVTFHRISDTRTRVMLQMDYEPENVLEKAGDALGAVKLTAKGNLKRFKELVESRGTETGAWRGTVQQAH